MTKIALRKIVTSLIGGIIPLAMFAGQDNVAPQAKVSVSDILGIGFEARNLVDGKVMYANEGRVGMQRKCDLMGSYALTMGSIGLG